MCATDEEVPKYQKTISEREYEMSRYTEMLNHVDGPPESTNEKAALVPVHSWPVKRDHRMHRCKRTTAPPYSYRPFSISVFSRRAVAGRGVGLPKSQEDRFI